MELLDVFLLVEVYLEGSSVVVCFFCRASSAYFFNGRITIFLFGVFHKIDSDCQNFFESKAHISLTSSHSKLESFIFLCR